MSSQQQKALFLTSERGKLVVGERDIPKPGKDQLLVKVHAAALNPIDYKIQQTGIFVERYPTVLGVDLAGIVEDVGEGVRDFAKGDKVFSHGSVSSDQSSFQQHAIAVADYTAKIPPNLDFDNAVTVPLGLDTAAVGLYSDQLGAGLTPPWVDGGQGKYVGNPILIVGGASSVGMYVIQLATLSGFSPIIAIASLVHQDELKALGVTDVVDRDLAGDEFMAALKKITQQPIGVVYDAIALPETQKKAWSVVGRGGTLVLTLQPVVKEEEGKARSVTATYGSPHAGPNQVMCREIWKILGKWLEDGVIKPNKFEVLPNGLNGIPDGLERLKTGEIRGMKLVAHPQETV